MKISEFKVIMPNDIMDMIIEYNANLLTTVDLDNVNSVSDKSDYYIKNFMAYKRPGIDEIVFWLESENIWIDPRDDVYDVETDDFRMKYKPAFYYGENGKVIGNDGSAFKKNCPVFLNKKDALLYGIKKALVFLNKKCHD